MTEVVSLREHEAGELELDERDVRFLLLGDPEALVTAHDAFCAEDDDPIIVRFNARSCGWNCDPAVVGSLPAAVGRFQDSCSPNST